MYADKKKRNYKLGLIIGYIVSIIVGYLLKNPLFATSCIIVTSAIVGIEYLTDEK